MFAKLLEADLDDLAVRGIRLDPPEIVHLNALALKIERGERSAFNIFNLPRCAVLGDLIFHEPSIGAELWIDEVGRLFNAGDSVTGFAIRAYAMTRDYTALPTWTATAEITEALKNFMAHDLARYTLRQVVACVNYCANGNDQTAGEYCAARKNDDDEPTDLDEISPAIGVIHEGQSLALGISLDDAQRMTRGALNAVIARAYQLKDFGSVDNKRALGEYYAELDRISNLHKATD